MSERTFRGAVFLWLIIGFIMKLVIVTQKGGHTKRHLQVAFGRAVFWQPLTVRPWTGQSLCETLFSWLCRRKVGHHFSGDS